MADNVVDIINRSFVDLQTKKALREVVAALVIEAGGVASVNGETGVVVLSAADVGAASTGALAAVSTTANNALTAANTAQGDADTAQGDIDAHEALTENVHGIPDTAELLASSTLTRVEAVTAYPDPEVEGVLYVLVEA